MTTHTWHQLREHAINLFAGDTPGADLEQRILEHFTERPAHVARAIESVGTRVANGKIRSGWAVLRRELDTKAATDVAVDDLEDRTTQIRLAKTWIVNTGGYFDRDTELEDELFGDLGRLHDYADQTQIRDEIARVYTTERPRFAAAEQEHVDRNKRHGDKQRELRKLLRHATPKDMPDTADEDIPIAAEQAS